MNSSEVHKKKIRGITGFDLNAPPNDERIDALMQEYLQRLRLSLPKHRRATGRVPGAAVAVRKGTKVIHIKGYGCANLETGRILLPKPFSTWARYPSNLLPSRRSAFFGL